MAARPWLGVIADDYTGATDVAAMIARHGMRVVQHLGVPADPGAAEDADVIVIALKSRSIPAPDAVTASREAAEHLRALGVSQLYFKYCSTFDSTDEGNIGPVADALADLTGARSVAFCPATPEHGRTTYSGHHFVGDVLLSESPLKDHPLNPMRDPDLRRVLGRQTSTPVTGLTLNDLRARRAEASFSARPDRTFVLTDAVDDDDVAVIARAVADAPLVTGGAALAAHLAAQRVAGRNSGEAAGADHAVTVPTGPAVVLAGSCSAATRRQLARLGPSHPTFVLDPYALAGGTDVVAAAVSFVEAHRDDLPVVAATSDPATVRKVQEDLGVAASARLVEDALGRIAREVVAQGVRRVLVAGGESSGAVVDGLGIRSLRIGAEVAPGVPWTVTTDGERVGLLLKSGNFGGDDVFVDALAAADAS